MKWNLAEVLAVYTGGVIRTESRQIVSRLFVNVKPPSNRSERRVEPSVNGPIEGEVKSSGTPPAAGLTSGITRQDPALQRSAAGSDRRMYI
jgi:hypothetical protein